MSSHAQHMSSLRNEASTRQHAEALARELFEQACRTDTFDDLKRRAAFDRQDAGRLSHWIRVAERQLRTR